MVESIGGFVANCKRKLVVFGTGDIAELSTYYFERDADFEVVAYTLNEQYIGESEFKGRPVVPFETLEDAYPPSEVQLFVGVGFSGVNQVRSDKYCESKEKGYTLATYISPRATFLSDNPVGENCFILEDNTVQPFVEIGENVVLWSGNHVGHHSVIRDHVFVSSHVVISGRVTIGERSFIGVNATLRNDIEIGERSVIGAGSIIMSSCDPESVFVPDSTVKARVPSSRLRKL